MRVLRAISSVALVVGVAACTEATSPMAPEVELTVAEDHTDGLYKLRGSGKYVITLSNGDQLNARMNVRARQVSADETARGKFRHRLIFNGELVDFSGVVTCMAVDPEEGRVWLGGVVHKNRSVAEPFASGDIYQPGKDIWFRALDVDGNEDRTTFTGFEGGAGIITSREYCDTRPWPADNARTNPFTKGGVNISER